MGMKAILNAREITELAKKRFQEERELDHLEGWFLAKEIQRECDEKFKDEADCIRIAKTQVEVMKEIPLSIGDYHVFAGTQDDSFARSYALINPAFTVDSFSGYCDPVAVFRDIEPIGDITQERIDALREYNNRTPYADALRKAYDIAGDSTSEAIFFIEQVTGHLIPDVRKLLACGTKGIREEIDRNQAKCSDGRRDYFEAMKISLGALEVLADRYAELAEEKEQASDGKDRERYRLMKDTLRKVPGEGAENLFEALQAFILIWQTMCLEQTPNPFAFSVGNADRIFEPYRAKTDMDREEAAALFKHLLVFFNVADRSWAISQNLIVGGKSNDGKDLTNLSSYALLDAYYDMNLPFLSPTVNIAMDMNDFVEMAENLPWYMEQQFEKIETPAGTCPAGLLGALRINFIHYDSFEEGVRKWEERKKRINWDNLFLVGTEKDGCTYETIRRFDCLPYKNKVIFTHVEYPEFSSAYYIRGFEEKEELGQCDVKANTISQE